MERLLRIESYKYIRRLKSSCNAMLHKQSSKKKKKRKENANEIFSLEEEQHRRDTRNPSKLKFPYESRDTSWHRAIPRAGKKRKKREIYSFRELGKKRGGRKMEGGRKARKGIKRARREAITSNGEELRTIRKACIQTSGTRLFQAYTRRAR